MNILEQKMQFDDSFTGWYITKNQSNTPFNILLCSKIGKDDITPRIYIMYENDECPYKLDTTYCYQLMDNKIKRIEFTRNKWNNNDELLLQQFIDKNIDIINKHWNDDTYVVEKEINPI